MTSQLAPEPVPRPIAPEADRPTLGQAHPPTTDDMAAVAPALLGGRELALAPVSEASGRALAQVVIGWPWLLFFGILAIVWVSTSAGLVFAFGIGLPMLVLGLVVARWFARVELARIGVQTGLRILPAEPRRGGPGWWSRFFAPLRDSRAWAATGYAALSTLTAPLTFGVTLTLAGGGLAAIFAPVYGTGPVLEEYLGWPRGLLWLGLVVGGLACMWLAALVAQSGTLLQVRMARGMLGCSRTQLQVAVADEARARAEVRAAHVEQTRSRVVGAADEERRRIERDLHDGAQQRLVALGVELGAAKRRTATDPQAAADALDRAHREVQETLAELRDLVRGIHPAVLTDRGLDAALSALASRSTVPVTVRTPDDDTLRACGSSAQAAAYFVVAEALTNVAKHASATSASVDVACTDGRLRLVVHDDGRGGAVATPGSGLDGLRSRVAALDGTFDLASPAGAGTTLTVEIPCAS